MASRKPLHLHFETRQSKPPVFLMTRKLIREAAARAGKPAGLKTTLGHDLADLSPLRSAIGLVASNDILRDPGFPLRDLAAAAPHLRWIHVIGAGIEPLLPLDWLPSSVTLTNNSGVHAEKVDEYAVMSLLLLNYRLPQMVTNQHRARWEQIFTPNIKGKTAVVVGLGDMGGTAARAARRLGVTVIGVRRQAKPHPHADRVVGHGQLDRVLPRADFLVVATPLTPETRQLIDAARLDRLKPSASVMNIGRAGVVDYPALAERLADGRIAGAILDVFDPEPLPADSPLWCTPNLIITPHCSSDDLDRYMPLTFDLVFANLARLAAGRPLKNAVDSKRGY
jgi:phosphoglycerate dehydrogenase-like enzyme